MNVLRTLIFLLISSSLSAQVIEVSASEHSYYRTPVFVKLPVATSTKQVYWLRNKQTGKSTAAQMVDSTTLVFILPDSLPAGKTFQYEVELSRDGGSSHIVNVQQGKETVQVNIRNRPLLVYHTATVQPPADSPAYYARSGFIHPLYSPNGKILTDDFPAGHAHQHALFSAWTNTTFKKEFTDFWNQHLQKGTVEHIAVEKINEGLVVTQLQLLLRYKSTQFGEVLKERWTITVYPFSSYFLFDLYSDQLNTSTDTLFINTYHYGGLAFRGSREWNPDDKVNYTNNWHILTSEGIKDSSANGTHAGWVDASGTVNGAMAGVTVFNHPANFRYPQAIRVHPAFPYWCYTPAPDGPFFIAPGAHYQSRYRYFVHNGGANTAQIKQLESEWISPPAVKYIREK